MSRYRYFISSVFNSASIWAFLLVPTVFAPTAQAQTVPTNCRPNAGAQYECATRFPDAYRYLAGSCGPGLSQPTEFAAFNVYRQQFQNEQCPPSYSLQGWIGAGSPMTSGIDFVISCGGYPGSYPTESYGDEVTNWLLEEVTKYSPWPGCQTPNEILFGAVRRERGFVCPDGYNTISQDVCMRLAATRNYSKMLGRSCPPKGQCESDKPINIGAGNKLKAETDYRAGGASPLRFTRYYNSLSNNASFSGHYRSANFELAVSEK